MTPSTFNILQVVASLEGGAARHVVYLSKELRAHGHRVAIAAPCDNPSVKTELEGSGFTFFELSLNAPNPLPVVRQLTQLIESKGFSHVHVHGHRAALLGRMANPRTGAKAPKLIYSVHGYHPIHYPNPITKQLVTTIERLMAPKTDAFICVSSSTQEELLRSIPNIEPVCHIVENGIPIVASNKEELAATREAGRSRFHFPADAMIIGTVARLQWQKGIDRLLKAFQNIQGDFPHAKLFIVGDGPEKDTLENLAKTLNIEERCLFAGRSSDTNKLYPMMDFFVLPSLWEGLPLSVLEAWDAEVPVITTNVPGSTELIEDKVTGYLADNTVEGIAEAIRFAIQDNQNRQQIIENALKKLQEQHSVRTMTERIEEVYRVANTVSAPLSQDDLLAE